MRNVYCVKDTKGGFVSPICYPNDEIARRAFTTVFFNKSDEMMINFPADYELWKVGEFNDRTGEITPEQTLIITGIEAANAAAAHAAKAKKGE